MKNTSYEVRKIVYRVEFSESELKTISHILQNYEMICDGFIEDFADESFIHEIGNKLDNVLSYPLGKKGEWK